MTTKQEGGKGRDRRDRLEAALRDNLKRRKAQARLRKDDASETAEQTATDPDTKSRTD